MKIFKMQSTVVISSTFYAMTPASLYTVIGMCSINAAYYIKRVTKTATSKFVSETIYIEREG